MDSKNANRSKPRRTNKGNTNSKQATSEKKWLKVLKSCLILLVFFVAVGLISAVVIFNNLKANTIEITDNNFWQNQSTALIYDNDGTQIGKLSEKVVSWTDICRDAKEGEEITEANTLPMCEANQVALVSPYYIEGLIATEDQGFMDHHGVNFKGMIRVTLSALVSGSTDGGGGSSITMQLAKLLYLGSVSMYDAHGDRISWQENDTTINTYDISYENRIQYKLSQMALAMKIEDKYKKQDIMENYVNTMWFGSGGYGIKNAAKYYYDVAPIDLTIAQSATLAGMTQRPYDWDPYTNPEGTTQRRNVVLTRMEAEGYITPEQATKAKGADISADLVDHSKDSKKEAKRLKYYNDINLYVLNELQDILGANADLNTGGMKIHTTVDPQLQEATVDILDTDKELIGTYILDGTQTGTAMIDVETGGILALGNGFDGQTDYAYAWNEVHYPGSSVKPLVAYSPAIEYLGWSTAHILNDKTTYYSGTDQEVRNYERNHSGNVTMMKALSESLNTTAVQAFQQVVDEIGIEGMTAWFGNVGLDLWKTAADSGDNVYESYALGAFNSTPLEMASAFATFANGGTYNAPHIIDYIEFDEQSPYYEIYGSKWSPEYESHKAMEPSTAYLITMMLNPENDGAFTTTADIPELDLAIKTGTSNWGPNDYGITEGSARDRWTVGYTPDVATAVWYAYDTEHQKDGYEFYSQPEQPLYIFHALMSETIDPDNDKLADGEFEMPDNVVSEVVNGVTHYYIKDSDDLVNKNTPPSSPYITIELPGSDKVKASWTESDGVSSYNVLVNGQVVDTTSKSSVTLSYDDLFATGCSSSYDIGVQAVGSNGLTSGVSSYAINNDTSNCSEEEPEDKEESKDEESKDEDKEESKDDEESKDEDKEESKDEDKDKEE